MKPDIWPKNYRRKQSSEAMIERMADPNQKMKTNA
jgi:hypothetical protein